MGKSALVLSYCCKGKFGRFERTPFWAAKVRNVSSVGSQFLNSFGFTASPTKHASCRAAPKQAPESGFTHPYPNFPILVCWGTPCFPPVLRRCAASSLANRSTNTVGPDDEVHAPLACSLRNAGEHPTLGDPVEWPEASLLGPCRGHLMQLIHSQKLGCQDHDLCGRGEVCSILKT